MTMFGQLKSARVFFPIVALGNIGLLTWWWLSAYEISNESGPIENLQAAVLFLVFANYSSNIKKLEGAGRMVTVIFCFFCFYMFFREVDFQDFLVSDLVLSITRGRTQKLIFWFSLLLICVYIIGHFTHFRTLVAAMLHWRAWPYYLFLVLIISGELAEEVSKANGNAFGEFAIPYGQFWEELLEFNAYMALLFASITLFEFNKFLCERAAYSAQKPPNDKIIYNRPACLTDSTKG